MSKTLSLYLTKKREASGLSQKEVSNKLGYSTSQFVSNWERGQSAPPIRILKKLAKIYKVSEREIFDIILSDTIAKVTKQLERKFKN